MYINDIAIQHLSGVPYGTRVHRGNNKVRAVDPFNDEYPRRGYPPYKERIICFPSPEDVFEINLAEQYATMIVHSDLPYAVTADGEPLVASNPDEYRLWPGTHELRFSSTCRVSAGKDPYPLEAVAGVPTEIALSWKHVDDMLCRIEPQRQLGDASFPLNGTTVELDDAAVKPVHRKGTVYPVPCETKKITVSLQGYKPKTMWLGSPADRSEAFRETCGSGKPWTPALMPAKLSEVHVDCHEVTVKQYIDYLDDVGWGDQTILPRTGSESLTFREAGREQRKDFPVNGITTEAAQRYCAWRAMVREKVMNGHVARLDELREAGGFGDERHPYPWGEDPEPSCARIVMASAPEKYGCTQSRLSTVRTSGYLR